MRATRGTVRPYDVSRPSIRYSLRVTASCLHGDDVNEVLDSHEVARISRVETCTMSMSSRSDEQIHHTGSGLPSRRNDGRGQLAVTEGDVLVHGQWVKDALQNRKPAKSFGPNIGIACHENTEMKFGERCRADGEFTVEFGKIGGQQDAGVKDGFQDFAPRGSRTPDQ